MTELNNSTFEELMQKDVLVVVDYFATWCGPCKMMHPIYEKAAKKFKNVTFASLDIDKCTEIAIKNNVQVVPTFVIYKKGQEIGRLIGYNSQKEFEQFIESHLD